MVNSKKRMLQEMVKHSNHSDVRGELRKMDMCAKVDALTVAVIEMMFDVRDIKTNMLWHRIILFGLVSFLSALALVVAAAIVTKGGL